MEILHGLRYWSARASGFQNTGSAARDHALEAVELVIAVNEIAEGVTHMRALRIRCLVQLEALGPALPTHLQKIGPQFPAARVDENADSAHGVAEHPVHASDAVFDGRVGIVLAPDELDVLHRAEVFPDRLIVGFFGLDIAAVGRGVAVHADLERALAILVAPGPDERLHALHEPGAHIVD